MIESQDQNEKMGGNRKGKTDTINSKTPVLDNSRKPGPMVLSRPSPRLI